MPVQPAAATLGQLHFTDSSIGEVRSSVSTPSQASFAFSRAELRLLSLDRHHGPENFGRPSRINGLVSPADPPGPIPLPSFVGTPFQVPVRASWSGAPCFRLPLPRSSARPFSRSPFVYRPRPLEIPPQSPPTDGACWTTPQLLFYFILAEPDTSRAPLRPGTCTYLAGRNSPFHNLRRRTGFPRPMFL